MTSHHEASRYPGARPFRDTDLDRQLFRGRPLEVQRLLHLMLSESVIVLYGKSGMGKSSILNAGVMEPLRAEGFLPAVVRLNDPKRGLVQHVFDAVRDTVARHQLEIIEHDADTLVAYFARSEIWRGDRLLAPILVFDQFEELFTLHGDRERQLFIRELAGLVKGCPTSDNSATTMVAPVRVLLSLREDFLARLEQLATAIPHILNSRFALGPLRREQAMAAIEQPASIMDPALVTPTFVFASGTVERVVAFLCAHHGSAETLDEEVEPFQLQIVCHHIENIVRARRADGASNVVIDFDALGGDKGLEKILQSFYENQITDAGHRHDRKALERLCEEGLISAHRRRLSLETDDIFARFGVTIDALSELVERRVLRAEPRVGSVYYELSHDTLVAPILQTRARRKRALRKRRFALGSALVAVALLAIGLYGFRRAREWAITQRTLELSDVGDSNDGRSLLQLIPLIDQSLSTIGRVSPAVIGATNNALAKSTFLELGTIPVPNAVLRVFPRGDLIVSGAADGSVSLWDLHGQLVRHLGGGTVRVIDIAVGSGTYTVAVLRQDGTVELWSITGTMQWVTRISEVPTTLAFSPDERLIALAVSSGAILLDGATGSAFSRPAESGSAGTMTMPTTMDALRPFMKFDKTGTRLASSQSDGGIRLWTVGAGGQLVNARSIHASADFGAWAISRDGSRLGSATGMKVGLVATSQQTSPDSATTDPVIELGSDMASAARSVPDSGRDSRRVTAVAVSDDGKRVVTARSDGRADVIDGNRRLRTITVHTGTGISALAVDKSGTMFTTVSEVGVRLWTSDGVELARLATPPSPVITLSVLFHPTKALILTGSTDGSVRLWSTASFVGRQESQGAGAGPATLQPIHVITRPEWPTGHVLSMAVNPRGDIVAIGDDEGRLELWQLTGDGTAMASRRIADRRWPGRDIRSVFFDPSKNSTLVVSIEDAGATVLVRSGDKLSVQRVFNSEGGDIATAGFATDGQVVLARRDGLIRVISPSGKERTLRARGTPITIGLPLDSNAILINDASGKWRALREGDDYRPPRLQAGLSYSRSMLERRERQRANGSDDEWSVAGVGSSVAASDDGYIAVGHTDGSLAIVTTSGSVLQRAALTEKAAISDVQFNADRSSVVAVSNAGKVFGLRRAGFNPDEGDTARTRLLRTETLNSVEGRRLSDVANRIYVTLSGGAVHGHDFNSGETLFSFKTGRSQGTDLCGNVTAATLIGGGRAILVGCTTGKLLVVTEFGNLVEGVLYSDKSYGAIAAIAAHPSRPFFVVGAKVASSNASDSDKDKWDVVMWHKDGHILRRWRSGHNGRVFALAASPDGETIASAAADTISIWSAAEKRDTPVRVLRGHGQGEINDLAFSADGNYLVSASDDRTVKVWNVRSGAETKTFVHGSSVAGAVFHGGGVLTFAGGDFQLWDLEIHRTPPVIPAYDQESATPTSLLGIACQALRSSSLLLEARTPDTIEVRRICERAWPSYGRPDDPTFILAQVSARAANSAARDSRDRSGRSELHNAAAAGHIAKVESLLATRPAVDQRDGDGRTALAEAVRNGQLGIVFSLLRAGADSNIGDWLENTPLHIAALNGDATIVSALLDHRADILAVNKLGVTPLMNAASKGVVHVADILLRHRAGVNATDVTGSTALMDAARGGHTSLVRMLLANGADPNQATNPPFRRRTMTALLWAQRNGHTSVVDVLTKMRPALHITRGLPDFHTRFALRSSPPAWTSTATEVRRLAFQDNEKSRQALIAVLSPAANGDDTFAKLLLGIAQSTGHQPAQRGIGAAWYLRAAQAGDATAQAALGLAYWMADVDGHQDMDRVRELLTASAESLNGSGLVALSLYKEQVEGDVQASAELAKRAAEQGDPVGQNMHGLKLQAGEGSDQKLDEAVSWFQKASAEGDLYATRNLGVAFAMGAGVERSEAAAIDLWQRAAFGGLPVASHDLGDLAYIRSEGPQSDARAYEWYNRAAEMGLPLSQVTSGCVAERAARTQEQRVSALVIMYRASVQQEGFAAAKLRAAHLKP